MGDLIKFVLSNYSLTFLVFGLFCSFADLLPKPKPLHKPQIIKALFSYLLLFSIGITFVYNFIMHVFFSEMSASFIGWEPSPFQYEVGFASLGFGIVGLLAFRRTLGFRAASVIGPSFFLWGAAGGHVYQMITTHNFPPGNAGVVFGKCRRSLLDRHHHTNNRFYFTSSTIYAGEAEVSPLTKVNSVDTKQRHG